MSFTPSNYVKLESLSEEHQLEITSSLPLRKKSLSPPNAPSKSTFSRSTRYISSSFPSESPTPTRVAPPPKLRFYVLIVNNWPSGPSTLSPPPRVSGPPPGLPQPPPGLPQPPPGFEHPQHLNY
ncbi:hypothetical protein Tco_0197691, partial [Tanacetum coccineum]